MIQHLNIRICVVWSMNKTIRPAPAKPCAEGSKLFHNCFSELSYLPNDIVVAKSEVN